MFVDNSEIVYSTYTGSNSSVLKQILRLYVPIGSHVIDLTYGKGRFWADIPIDDYCLWRNDIAGGCDFAVDALGAGDFFPEDVFGAVVIDPPYAVKPSGKSGQVRGADGKRDAGSYGTTARFGATDAENLEWYRSVAAEAHRLLKPDGYLILKTQDQYNGGCQQFKGFALTDIEGYVCEDLFIVVQSGKPIWDPKWKIQHHARKNHSYFLVHRAVC